MPALLALLVIIGAPDKTDHEAEVELRYRFTRGMTYVDQSQSRMSLRLFPVEDKLLEYDVEGSQKLRRTVLAVDKNGAATHERIEVLDYTHIVHKSPEKEGKATQRFASHGKSFVWKKSGKKWVLYGEGDKDVTKAHPQLVQRLKPWRDGRLPPGKIKAGSTWAVPAAKFLVTVGQPVPAGVKGEARFTVKSIEDGIAHIQFVFTQEYRDGDHDWVGNMTGDWRFNVKLGRDVSLKMKGRVDADKGEFGTGSFRKTRSITYADGR